MKVRGLLILLLLPSLAAAGQQYYGTVASSVNLPGPADPGDALRIFVRAGDTVTAENVRASIQALYDTGRYNYIEVDATPGPNGTDLTFRARQHYFFGIIRLEPAELLERSISTYFRIPLGERFSATVVDGIITGTSRLLEDAGYFNAMIVPDYAFDDTTKLVTVVLKTVVQGRATIGAIEVRGGAQTFSNEELLDFLDQDTGDDFLADSLEGGVTEIRKKFTDLGFLNTRVNVERAYDPVKNTVGLQIGIEPGVFTLVQTRGYEISRTEIRSLVPVFEEGTIDPDLVEEGRANIVEYLQQEGYFESTVAPELIEAPLDNAVQINYVIEPGERYTIRTIDIEGSMFFTEGALRDRMAIRGAGFLDRGSYSPELLTEDIATIEAMYRNAGFQGTNVQGHEEVTADHKVDVTITIEEGSRFLIDRVAFTGNQTIPEEELRKAVTIEEGQTYTPTLVEGGRTILMGMYYGRGFPDVQITATLDRNDAAATLSVTFQVIEGEAHQIGRLIVTGNTLTAEKIIHRNSGLYPNTPYNREAILEAQQRLYATGLFTRVEIVPLEENLGLVRNLLIHVEDAKPILLTYGVGVKEFEGLRGTFEISHTNLFGLDRAISVRIRASRRERYLQSTYREPRLFNRDIEGFASLYVEKAERRFYDVNRVDFSIQALRRLSVKESLLLTANYQTVNLQDIKVNPSARRFPDVRGVIQIARLGASFVGDWRDDVIEPQQGTFSTTTFQVANKKWGSEVNFISGFNQSNYYKRVTGGVVALSTRIGLNRPYGGENELPISERYFAGGSTTLRGFDLDEAGPPGGGQLLTIGNIEYRFPLTFIPVAGFGSALFYDTGNVFERPSDFGVNNFTHTVGTGLRYQTPLGPVRLDIGLNLNPKLRVQTDGSQVREERVQVFFTLGNTF